jgi:putative glycosyltransferase (TIGR04372 family)
MFYKILDYLNSVSFCPFYFVTPLVYGYGTSADHLLLSICKKNKNKKLIILYPSVLQSYFKYNIPNKYLLNNLVIEGIPQKNYRYFKFVLNIFVNFEFVIRRFLLFFLNLFKIKLSEQFRFPLVGVIQIFVNNNNFEENILSTNLNFSIDLEDEKNIESKKYLKSMGISENDKFVCIHVRDSLYYDDDERRSFRNSSLENYKDLIEYLIENNYHVIRLGVKNKLFEFKHKKFLDYSTFENKKDFLELYLIKNCSFFIGTQSGPLSVASLFNKPIMFTNAVRIFESFFPLRKNNDIVIFKNIKWKKNGKKIDFNDYIKLSAKYHHFRFINEEIIFEENTPSELKSTLLNFVKNLDKKDYQLSKTQLKFNNFVKLEYFKKNLVLDKNDYLDKFFYLKTKCLLENTRGSFCQLFLDKNFDEDKC